MWSTLLAGVSCRFKIPLLGVICLATAYLNTKPELASVQNKYMG